ncbi:LysR family transcriptional regulator [Dactylosporangium sp. NPDC005572]|uniref:LysR family transcriptional regulator n=1 Tax=Dactylosporangium sp. NPDC005572 TaxID=3156889 RepID=UPI0033AC35EB
MDFSLVALRVFREVAERGTFTAAATALGYTQSAVSRQIAGLERTAGTALLERRRDGVRLTPAGEIVLRRAAVVLDELAATARELAGRPADAGAVRLGWFTSAGASLVPRAVADLRRTHPGVAVTTREGSTTSLVRALRAGTVDLAVLAAAPPYRPLDAGSPPLAVTVLAERTLRVAVPISSPLAAGDAIDLDDLRGQRWIAGPPARDEQLMGVWPGLGERAEIAHTARDWLAKLSLVAAGAGITTVPLSLAPLAPAGVRVLPVRGGPDERRRVLLAHLPGPLSPPARLLAAALREAAT